jgi:hypothetical protein
VDVEQGDDESGPGGVASDATGRLDILGRGLRLPEHDHQAEPGDVEANGDHVRGERDINALLLRERQRQLPLGVGDLVRAFA